MSQNKSTGELSTGVMSAFVGAGLTYAGWMYGDHLAALPAGTPEAAGTVADVFPDAMMAGGVGIAALGVNVLARRYSKRGRVRAKYQNPGWPDYLALRPMRRAAMLSTATSTRPSFGHVRWYNWPIHWGALGRWGSWGRITPTEYAIYLGASVVGPTYAQRLYAAHQDVVMVIAPPQSGKTAWLCCALIDTPGAVITTSTKPDAYEHTHHLRAKRGPVYTFNPQDIGGVESTLSWNPVPDCVDYQTAADRAASFVRGVRAGRTTAPTADAAFWEDQAVKILRCFLMAAALSGQSLRAVARWCTTPTDREPLDILREHAAKVPDGWVNELGQILNTEAEKTRESIYLTVQQSMRFMANPIVADAVCPAGGSSFDLASFVRDKGTLYLIGDGQDIAPLLVCLTTYLFDGAKKLAAAQPKNRLDPPLMFALDECALIVPVELDRWTADAGGRNINIIFAAQALSQLFNVYGERGGQTIRTNSNCQIYFGGETDPVNLAAVQGLASTYEHKAKTEHKGGQRHGSESEAETLRPTIDAAGVREIPPHHALVVYRTVRPTIIRVDRVWARRDVKAAKREAKRAAAIPAMREPAEQTTAAGADPGVTP